MIRKIDELGRIVIPMEVRKAYGLQVATPLEMFIGENGEIILKRYFSLEEKIIETINELEKECISKKEIIEIIEKIYDV